MVDLLRISELDPLVSVPPTAVFPVVSAGVTYQAAQSALVGANGTNGTNGAAGTSSSVFPLYFGATNTGNTTSARFLSVTGTDAIQTTEANGQEICPYSGVITDLFARFQGGALVTANCTFTLRVNGVDTALTLTINATNQSGHTSGGSVAVVEGDLISIKTVCSVGDTATSVPRVTLKGT